MGRLSAVPDSRKPHILILGGTTEAAALARSLVDRYGDRFDVTTSLAGRTRTPAALPGQVRSGGFGGVDAFMDYLIRERVAAVVDATHPFAARMSENAVAACERADIPRLVLLRPPWVRQKGDNWIEFETAQAAAAALPRYGRRAFLTVGVQELAPFAAIDDMWFLVRLIEGPTDPLSLADCQVITGRGPFSADGEQALLESHEIDLLVTKASGGAATAAKLEAARRRGLPVVMIQRPPPPPGSLCESPESAVEWVLRQLAP